MWQTWVQLLVLALLTFYLLRKQHQRIRQRWPAIRRGPKRPGQAINTATLQSRIHHLREDYVEAVRKRPPVRRDRELLAASIRRSVWQRAYFRRRRAECTDDLTHEPTTSHE